MLFKYFIIIELKKYNNKKTFYFPLNQINLIIKKVLILIFYINDNNQ